MLLALWNIQSTDGVFLKLSVDKSNVSKLVHHSNIAYIVVTVSATNQLKFTKTNQLHHANVWFNSFKFSVYILAKFTFFRFVHQLNI